MPEYEVNMKINMAMAPNNRVEPNVRNLNDVVMNHKANFSQSVLGLKNILAE